MTRPHLARQFVRAARNFLRDMYENCGKEFDHGSIEIEKVNLKKAYDELGRALDELGVPRLKPEHCKHPPDLREYINSSADRCGACGRVNAMVATRSGASRKWVDPGDDRIAFGKMFTDTLLESEREKARVKAESQSPMGAEHDGTDYG